MFYDYSTLNSQYYTCSSGSSNNFLSGPIVYDIETSVIVQTPTDDQITAIIEVMNIDLSILITQSV